MTGGPVSLPSHPHSGHPSAWLRRFVHLIPRGGTVLDVACGQGRHLRWLHDLGFRMTGVDRDPAAIEAVRPFTASAGEAVLADIENGPWPFDGRQFDAVIVTNYLWRPLLTEIIASVADGGVLLYETFAAGNETVGKPSRPDFLLRPGELITACQGLRIVAYEDGFLDSPERFVQRIAAVRQAPETPVRYPLAAPAA
jgi:SAM-dependent methyltransferase